MTLLDGYTDLPAGKIASVVTYLEMREPPPALPAPAPAELSVHSVEQPTLDWYRNLYRAVGQEWLWFNRLRMTDQELSATIHHPQVHVYALSEGSEDKGLLELDSRSSHSISGKENEIEIAYFGLTPDLIGQGAGQYFMAHALSAAWSRNPQRVWVHTCTLDHPHALSFYLKAGFKPYKRAIEIADDPRLAGKTPRTAAPHIPLIEPH
jgi:GNAT superfamily N-acetyltransferase